MATLNVWLSPHRTATLSMSGLASGVSTVLTPPLLTSSEQSRRATASPMPSLASDLTDDEYMRLCMGRAQLMASLGLLAEAAAAAAAGQRPRQLFA